ncbi:MAG: hypothetical protein KF849_13335 [Rhizobiaceae bacterium]|nr:hypothetical protein [Rhizobiaceae bacterium]
MKKASLILLATTTISGCGASVASVFDDLGESRTTQATTHIMTGHAGPDNSITAITDVSKSGVTAAATTTWPLGVPNEPMLGEPDTAELAFSGKMDGPAVPNDSGKMTADNGASIRNQRRTYSNGDNFLELVGNAQGGTNLFRYTSRKSGFQQIGYLVDGTRSTATPTSGNASYRGPAEATIVGSATGQRIVEGTAALNASFAGQGGSISGKIDGLRIGSEAQPYSFALGAATIKDRAFAGGDVQIARDDKVPILSSGDYQGFFLGSGAQGVAGTFYVRSGIGTVPTKVGGVDRMETIEGVGIFGAEK